MNVPHSFRDPALLEEALTHASTGRTPDNERLEFLGDAVLDLIVAEELYRRDASRSEGELTERKAAVVSRRALAEAAKALGLGELAHFGAGIQDRAALPRSVLANLYEAVLGAIYLDGGLEPARDFALVTLDRLLAEAERSLESDRNPKQTLQHLCQTTSGAPPVYELLDERGHSHARAFRVRAVHGARAFPSAWGRTRKEAERWAAHEALLCFEATDDVVENGRA
ncbi:MAG: ribonuclease III [Planctomycetota bacterium]